MVKTLEIVLLVGAAIAAYMFTSKTDKTGNVSFIDPFHDLHNKAQTQAVNQNQNQINTLESVRQSNLSIADNILTSERNIADLLIARQQTELDRTQSYVSSQQKIGAAAGFSDIAPGNWSGQSLLNKFSQAGFGQSLFPDFRLINNRENYDIVKQQSQYETAQSNIRSANQSIMQQAEEIDRINQEYRTNYGTLSRYG